jgi:hypothetical protein
MINTTPMNPARSNKWKLMVIATATARRHESRVLAAHYNHCPDWFSTAPIRTGSGANPLHIGRLFSGKSAYETISCSECRSVFCDLIVCVLIEGAHRLSTGICLPDTRQEIMIKVGTSV